MKKGGVLSRNKYLYVRGMQNQKHQFKSSVSLNNVEQLLLHLQYHKCSDAFYDEVGVRPVHTCIHLCLWDTKRC